MPSNPVKGGHYRALQHNALLLVFEGRDVHDDLHHAVLEAQRCPHPTFNTQNMLGIIFLFDTILTEDRDGIPLYSQTIKKHSYGFLKAKAF